MQARNRMYAMLDSVISRRREGGEVRSDFLQTLLRKHDAGGGDDADKLTDSQLKDNILTLLVAGHDTTTAGLTWLVKFLGENPGVLEKLREEHLGIRGRLMSDGTPPPPRHRLRWSDVSDMPYTNKVMNETLRRATILPWFSRKAAQDFSIDGWCHATHLSITNSPLLRLAALLMDAVKKPLNAAGYDIKEGTSVNLDVVSIHHDPAVFAEPERFHPDRFDVSRCRQPWLADDFVSTPTHSTYLPVCVNALRRVALQQTLKPYSFLGFGSGPRMCPGMNLARLEICVFVHHLVCRYDWKPLAEDDSVQPTLVRMPKNKYPIVATAL